MRDLRLAVRSLLRTPLVSAVVVLSLALGIGANTAVFGVVNSLFLRPLPVADPASLVTITSDFAVARGFKAGVGWNAAMWRRLRERAGLFGGVLAWSAAGGRVVENGAVDQVNVMFVDGGFFSTLGVRARYGRTLTAADDVPGSPDGPVAVISDRFWQRRFNRDPAVIGKPLVLDGTTFTVVGVTPPEFFGMEVGRTFDVALPLARGPSSDRAYVIITMLRLKPGQSVHAATLALRSIHADLLGVTPGAIPSVNPAFLREPLVLLPAPTGISDRGARAALERPLVFIAGATAFVLLIGTLNLATLSLSRAAARHREMAVRLALGAPRWRLARGVLLEGVLIAAAAAAGGLVVAAWAGPALAWRFSNANTSLFLYQPFDWRVLGFTAAAALTTAFLIDIVPAYRATRVPVQLAANQLLAAAPRQRFGLAGGFVLLQVVLSIVLVTGTGLFARTFQRLANAPLGFEPDSILVVELGAGQTGVAGDARLDLYGRVIDRVAATPGVAGIAASWLTPLGSNTRAAIYDEPGRTPENPVTPGWFAVFGTRLLTGRDFDARDVAGAPPVAVVNDAYARKFFTGRNPLGQPIDAQARSAGAGAVASRTIVGVVADAAFGSVRQGPRPTIYLPLAQSDLTRETNTIRLSVRAANGNPAGLISGVSAAITNVDPRLTFNPRRLIDDVAASIASERTLAILSSTFGVLALLLAGLGLYGVTSAAVSTRRRELAIRVAVGMLPARGVGLIMSRVALLLGAGTLLGIVIGLWLAKYTATLVYGLEPRDPAVFATSAAVLAAVGVFAAWLPARHAASVDPAELLRDA
jgi:predicted permease